MSGAALSLPGSTSRAAINPWVVAAVVVVPTFMEVLDTTIAVVALRYIAGGLSATVDDGEWVITSYLAANAIILPITGWLIAHLGRRNYFLLSIGVFTLASGLCGMATSLGQLILFRVVQGLAGGGLQPSSQGVLLDAFPPERQGMAMTLFGLAALIAPVVGPTLGGWITDDYTWRWVFWINVPVGLLALGACAITLRDPDYLTAQRTELHKRPFSFDGIGLSLLVIVIVCWEVMLSKGQEWDWLGDPFWRVQMSEPGGEFPTVGRAEFRRLLHHHFLRLRRAVCFQHRVAGPAADVVRLRRAQRRAGHVAGRHLCRDHHAVRGTRTRSWDRCAVGDRRGSPDHGGGELLDVADEPGHQSGASCLAAGGTDHRDRDVLRPGKHGGLHLHADRAARGCGWCVEPAAQRGRQRRDLAGSNDSGAS
jgi:hypothetical protein